MGLVFADLEIGGSPPAATGPTFESSREIIQFPLSSHLTRVWYKDFKDGEEGHYIQQEKYIHERHVTPTLESRSFRIAYAWGFNLRI